MHAIERELIKITDYKVKRKFSDRQDYLKSLFNAAQKLSDSEFDELSDEAATWLNECVSVFNTKRDADIPDFDEANGPSEEDLAAVESDDESEEVENGNDAPDTDADDSNTGEDEPEAEAEEIVSAKQKEKIKIPRKPRKNAKPKIKDDPPPQFDSDAVLDKWGCLVGSKNAQALALFEKGATTREVKDKIGGTYYNILGKMEQRGHKVVKEGNLITITHKDESKVSSRKPKK